MSLDWSLEVSDLESGLRAPFLVGLWVYGSGNSGCVDLDLSFRVS